MERTFISYLWLFMIIISPVIGNQLPGSVLLDPITINKTILAYPFTLIKFDDGSPAGEKHDLWRELALEFSQIYDLCIAEVRFTDDKINHELAKKFSISSDTTPEIILAIRSVTNLTNDEDPYKLIRYGAEMNGEKIKSFLKHKAGIGLQLPGCSRRGDQLAGWYMSNSGKAHRENVLKVAEKELDSMDIHENQHQISVARKYIKIMKFVMEKGDKIINSEQERLYKIISGEKMSNDKREDMKKMLNIYKSFSNDDLSFGNIKKKDEL